MMKILFYRLVCFAAWPILVVLGLITALVVALLIWVTILFYPVDYHNPDGTLNMDKLFRRTR